MSRIYAICILTIPEQEFISKCLGLSWISRQSQWPENSNAYWKLQLSALFHIILLTYSVIFCLSFSALVRSSMARWPNPLPRDSVDIPTQIRIEPFCGAQLTNHVITLVLLWKHHDPLSGMIQSLNNFLVLESELNTFTVEPSASTRQLPLSAGHYLWPHKINFLYLVSCV